MPGLVRHFRDLEVYQEARVAAKRLFDLTKKWPTEERFALTQQIRNSSRSVCANIAEGWRKRRYPGAFVSKFSDSEAEAAETQVWIEFSIDCGYTPPEEGAELDAIYEQIAGRIAGMIVHVDKWCLPRAASQH